MTDLFQSTLKQNFSEVFKTKTTNDIIIKHFMYWGPENWRQHYDSIKFIKFKVAPKGLIYSETFAKLKPAAQTTLIFALTQISFEPQIKDKRHNSNRKTLPKIKCNQFTLPIAALQAIGVGSRNTCSRAIKKLITNNIITQITPTKPGIPNIYAFKEDFIYKFICV